METPFGKRRFGFHYRRSISAGPDFSEPVTQNTKRFVRCFWALDKSLAYARHYPAINWTSSYSEYIDDLSKWYRDNIDPAYMKKSVRSCPAFSRKKAS